MNVCMDDVWMDGWMPGRMYGCINESKDGWMDVSICECLYVWTDGCTE